MDNIKRVNVLFSIGDKEPQKNAIWVKHRDIFIHDGNSWVRVNYIGLFDYISGGYIESNIVEPPQPE